MISEGIARVLNDSTQGVLVDGVSKAGADVLTEALTNEEAVEILRGANSGLKPDLSRRGYRFVKRVFDIVSSSAAIAVLLVPGLILSIVIYVKSPGASPLYSQLRVGRLRKGGTYGLFRMWKFRSMVPNADEMSPICAIGMRLTDRCSRSRTTPASSPASACSSAATRSMSWRSCSTSSRATSLCAY